MFHWLQSRVYRRHCRNQQERRNICTQLRFHKAEGVFFGEGFESRGEDCITIGEGTHFDKHCVVSSWKMVGNAVTITIGEGCDFGMYRHQ